MENETENLDTPVDEAPPVDAEPEAAPDAERVDGDEPSAQPREVIRGIHPELKCECPECAPEYTELQFFSPEEEKKAKGTIMLYCARSSRKYFSPAQDFNTWYQANAPKRKSRKEG